MWAFKLEKALRSLHYITPKREVSIAYYNDTSIRFFSQVEILIMIMTITIITSMYIIL